MWGPRDQPHARVCELSPGLSAAIGGVGDDHLHPGSGGGDALFDQLHCVLVVLGAAFQHAHGGNQLLLGVHRNGQLVAVEANVLALPPVPNLGIMHGGNPLRRGALANSNPTLWLPLHVLQQELAQQLARCQQPPFGPTALKWSGDSKSVYCVAWTWPDAPDDEAYKKKEKQLKEAKSRAVVVDDAQFRYWDKLPLALDTAAEVATQTPLLRPALWLLPILLGQLPAQFPDAVGEQVVGVLDRSLPENRSGVQRQLQLPLRLQIAPLARQLEAALEGQPHLLVQDQLGPE